MGCIVHREEVEQVRVRVGVGVRVRVGVGVRVRVGVFRPPRGSRAGIGP